MEMRPSYTLCLCGLIAILSISCTQNKTHEVWSIERASEWSEKWGWLRGANFQPSTAINQLEMFQSETFDSLTIERELEWASDLGFNCMRVYLHHQAWETDREGFKKRLATYLDISWQKGIGTMLVFFDDCWNAEYQSGTQPPPKPGIHNSGWVQDPGKRYYEDPTMILTLEAYVKDMLESFAEDERIVLWDLYNEPGNSGWGDQSLPLLKKVVSWAREINPSQPITIGVWNSKLTRLNQFQLENSDIISYHNYDPPDSHQKSIDTLKRYGRPLICSEYMARTRGSRFENTLPLLKKEQIGAINWGFVSGKTNTIYEWDKPIPSGEEPELWFHDILRTDGTPYSEAEVNLIRQLTGKMSPRDNDRD